MARHVFLDKLAATAGLGDHRGNAVLRGDRHQRPGSLTGWCGLHGPASSVRVGHSLDARVEGGVKRLAVADEWDEILDQIAGVQVDRVVAFTDDLSEEAMREPLAPGSVGLARTHTVEIVALLRVPIDAALVESRTVEKRKDEDRVTHGVG